MALPMTKLTRPVAKRQYVAAAGYARGPRRLPEISKDPVTDLRCDYRTLERIACDPEAAAALLLLVIFVLADGVQFSPAVAAPAEGKTDPEYDRAVAIKDHIERTVNGLERTLVETLEMLIKPAMTFGNKVAEKVYEIPTGGPDANRLVLKSIKVLKRGATSFVVDDYMNLLGLVPANYTAGSKLASEYNPIPPEKFVIASFRMEDEDPRGVSIFKAALKPWHVKQLAWPEFLAYLVRWATPSIIAILSEKALDEVQYEADGVTPKTDPDTGQAITSSAAAVVVQTLEAFKNSSIAVFENGTTITPIEATGEGEVFEKAFDVLNSQIRKAVLLQELATADAEHQTKSSTGEQMGIVELLVWSIKRWVCDSIICRQIVYPQVLWNYGEQDARELCPKVSMGDTDRKDWSKDATAVVALATATAIDENGTRVPVLTYSQLQSLLRQIGIEPPTEEEVKAMRMAAEERRRQAEKMREQTDQPPADDKRPGQQPDKEKAA